jgi:1-phosphofructokinase
MIVTLTPNPSVDRTVTLPRLERGAVLRATESREDPGGKGLNVSRALAANGTASTAVFPVGGVYGRLMLNLLEGEPVTLGAVAISEAIRANITIVEPDGTTTKVNEPGPALTASEADALRSAALEASRGASWVVCCGSLPPGLSDDFYAQLIRHCNERGVRVAVDTSGEPMSAALAAKPALIKPNRIELAEAVGRELGTIGEVIDAASALVETGIETVVISLGRDGALLVDAAGAVQAAAGIGRPVSTVGAGDALLAGYLHAVDTGSDRRSALVTAVAFGSAAVLLPGSSMPGPTEVAAISVDWTTTPDRDQPLND